MDVALACHIYDPAAGFNLDNYGPDGTGVANIIEWRGTLPMPTQQELDDAWVIAQMQIAAEQAAEDEQAAADAEVLPHLGALQALGLTAQEQVDTLLGRAYAITNGATQGEIDAIVSRATALDWLKTNTWWTDWMGLPDIPSPSNAQMAAALKALCTYQVKREKAWAWVLQTVIAKLGGERL